MQFGIIGKTLKHSFSAYIHPLLYDCNYQKQELSENELANFLIKKDFLGINVTIPYKQAVIPYIDVLDETAKEIGAVNTIVNKNGVLYGYNTDFLGLKALIEKNNISLNNKNVLILGGGGTSLTAKAVCRHLGAKSFNRLSRKVQTDCDLYSNIEKYYDKTDIIINTTPCGMFPDIYESAINIDKFTNLEALFDVVYNPIRTKIVVDAKNRGIVAEGGTYMLVFQAIYAAKLFVNDDIPLSKGEDIYNDLINSKQNIVLIGMPSSGKTTIGKELSEITGRKLVDTDEEIYKKTSSTPKEIIEKNGEEFFRKIESEVVFDVSKNQGIIIATGGGVVLNEKNIDLLKENGLIFFIDRDFDKLSVDDSRPLSSTVNKLYSIYENRLNLYKNYADFIIRNDDIKETTNKILRAMNL